MRKKKLRDTGERLIVHEKYHDSPHFLQHRVAYTFATDFVKDRVVLDDGCGSGHGAYYLRTHGAQKVVGVDLSPEAIEYAKKRYRYDNLQFETMDCTNLSFPDGTFDVIISFQVIEHIPNALKFLNEAKRVLKESGLALISTPNEVTFSPGTPTPQNPFHVKEYTLQELAELLWDCFPAVEIYGVRQSEQLAEFRQSVERSLRKRFERFLRRAGLLSLVQRIVPKRIRYFFSKRPRDVSLSDFSITKADLESCLDFIAVCKKK